jgi:hypothetical protein
MKGRGNMEEEEEKNEEKVTSKGEDMYGQRYDVQGRRDKQTPCRPFWNSI